MQKEFQNLCFVSVLSRRQKIAALVFLSLDERFTIAFSHIRSPSLVPRGRRKGLEDKTHPAMDLLVHGEFDGASFRTASVYYDRFIKVTGYQILLLWLKPKNRPFTHVEYKLYNCLLQECW